jgi:hypothetical protein
VDAIGLLELANHPGDRAATLSKPREERACWVRMSSQHYRLIVEGELGPRYASAFGGMTISAHDGVTELTGPIVDAAHLQGLLERVAGLGLRVRSLTPVGAESADDARRQPQTTNPDASMTD